MAHNEGGGVRAAWQRALPSGSHPVDGPWAQRVRAEVFGKHGPVFARVSLGAGADLLLEALESVDRPLIRVDLGESGAYQAEAAAQFVDEVNRATRSRLLQYGLGLQELLTALDGFLELLGPFVVVFTSGGPVDEALLACLGQLNRAGTKAMLIAPETPEWLPASFAVLDSELRVTVDEGLWVCAGTSSRKEVESLIAEAGGSYASLLQFVGARGTDGRIVGASREQAVADVAREFGLSQETIVFAAMKRKRYIEAFRIACEQVHAAVPTIVDECGEAFFSRGLFDRFWILLSRLPDEMFEVESVLRWHYATAMALNRHSEVIPRVEGFLLRNEAPELRAQYAASRPGRDLLSETSRAVSALESPITLRHHAFALSFSGRLSESVETSRRALRLAELLGRDQLVVAIATDIASVLQRKGEFREALWWADWAASEYVERGLNEHFRRQCALAAMVFGRLLTGDTIGIGEILRELQVSEGLLGVPSYEGVVSTVADALFVNGQTERALHLYEAVYESNPFDQVASAAVDLVKCLCELGRVDEAMDVAGRSLALSKGGSEYQHSCALLAMGIALRCNGDSGAAEYLSRASDAFRGEGDAIRYLQCKLNLILLSADPGEVAHAATVLGDGTRLAMALGESGWTLLGGHSEKLQAVRALIASGTNGLEVRLLGGTSVSLHGVPTAVSDRQLDLLVVLVQPNNGLSLQDVAARVYGDRAVLGTAKALVSRLRDQLPIESRPYRIGVPFTADFLELQEHLRAGRVRQALNLYKGPLLPGSEAPAVVELREHIDESLRQAVLASGDAEAMIELANRTDAGDLELLEAAFELVPQNDPQSPLLRARIRQVRRDWESEAGGGDVRPSRPDGRSGGR